MSSTDMDDGKDGIYGGEPEGGWVTAPPLHDTIITSVTLCTYTGILAIIGKCPARELGGHPDVDCYAVYVLQAELEAGGIVTTSLAGDEPTLST